MEDLTSDLFGVGTLRDSCEQPLLARGRRINRQFGRTMATLCLTAQLALS